MPIELPDAALLHYNRLPLAIGNGDLLERMSKKRRQKSKQTPAVETDQAFDQWVARQLHKVYDEVLSEPVPDQLLRLVEQLDGQCAADEPTDAPRNTTDKPDKR